MISKQLAISIVAAILTVIWVALIKRKALHWGLLDIPNERSSHRVPTPRGGGLAIAGVVLLGMSLLPWISDVYWRMAITYIASAGLVAALGWLDDRRPRSPILRLGLQSVAASIAIYTFGHFTHVQLPVLGEINLNWIGLPITLLWIVGLTNAYNFMDGIDGLAAGQAVITGMLWWAVGTYKSETLAFAGILIASASMGFLFHNWPPARIFMGDVGSGFLGFSFAVLPLMMSTQSVDKRYFIIGVLFVGVFVFDTGVTFLSRIWRHERILMAHRSHIYQRLIQMGYSHRVVTTLYLVLAALVGTFGLVYLWAGENVAFITVLMALVLLFALWLGVSRLERQVRLTQMVSRN